MKKGKLYAIGVGPGDEELITVKAVKILKNSKVIFVPESKNKNTAFDIIKNYIHNSTEIIKLNFPMIHDKLKLNESWNKCSDKIIEKLEKGQDGVFITLGDVCFYSTFAYIKNKIIKKGFEIEIIPGISSFSAGASACKITICENDDKSIIIPYLKNEDKISYYIDNFDSIILMKVFKKFEQLKTILSEKNIVDKCILFSNIGMEGECIYKGNEILDINELGYFTTLIIKKKGEI